MLGMVLKDPADRCVTDRIGDHKDIIGPEHVCGHQHRCDYCIASTRSKTSAAFDRAEVTIGMQIQEGVAGQIDQIVPPILGRGRSASKIAHCIG